MSYYRLVVHTSDNKEHAELFDRYDEVGRDKTTEIMLHHMIKDIKKDGYTVQERVHFKGADFGYTNTIYPAHAVTKIQVSFTSSHSNFIGKT